MYDEPNQAHILCSFLTKITLLIFVIYSPSKTINEEWTQTDVLGIFLKYASSQTVAMGRGGAMGRSHTPSPLHFASSLHLLLSCLQKPCWVSLADSCMLTHLYTCIRQAQGMWYVNRTAVCLFYLNSRTLWTTPHTRLSARVHIFKVDHSPCGSLHGQWDIYCRIHPSRPFLNGLFHITCGSEELASLSWF